uniref:hypothetical protein n=1 Tax=Treponema phagedenis TaxID=162 RepID=UPI0001F63F8D|nr:hypothetical protein [Treponema phagedenis]EFW37262.1 hypothetical protein HMPREF9554_02272 [Treponema phagedenis F0421]TYT79299.1 hypothetical protein FS559_09460 [Treponema phagedenis]
MNKFISVLLALCVNSFVFALDLHIPADHIIIKKESDGFHLFIKKTPGIGSVLLTESMQDPHFQQDSYAYRATEFNAINGNEKRILNGKVISNYENLYSLIDSTPEHHKEFGSAFHILIPETVVFGYPWSRHGTIQMKDRTFINIRTFAKPYADYSGGYKDNPFLLRITDVPAQKQPAVQPKVEVPLPEKPVEPIVPEIKEEPKLSPEPVKEEPEVIPEPEPEIVPKQKPALDLTEMPALDSKFTRAARSVERIIRDDKSFPAQPEIKTPEPQIIEEHVPETKVETPLVVPELPEENEPTQESDFVEPVQEDSEPYQEPSENREPSETPEQESVIEADSDISLSEAPVSVPAPDELFLSAAKKATEKPNSLFSDEDKAPAAQEVPPQLSDSDSRIVRATEQIQYILQTMTPQQ